jgi:hypothetical protein
LRVCGKDGTERNESAFKSSRGISARFRQRARTRHGRCVCDERCRHAPGSHAGNKRICRQVAAPHAPLEHGRGTLVDAMTKHGNYAHPLCEVKEVSRYCRRVATTLELAHGVIARRVCVQGYRSWSPPNSPEVQDERPCLKDAPAHRPIVRG